MGVVGVFIGFLFPTIIFILIMRLLGAWMLKINEVIRLLKEIKILLGGSEENLPLEGVRGLFLKNENSK